MIAVAILRRRLREGKTYEDFRRAWYHDVGFGTSNRMLTILNVADPREVIVIALTETTPEQAAGLIEIDAAERSANPLDDVIEPRVHRTFGILVSEDDFSASGEVRYKPPTVGGKQTDLAQVQKALDAASELLADYLEAPSRRPDRDS